MNDNGTAALLIVTALVDLLDRSPGGEGMVDMIDQYMVELSGRSAVDAEHRAGLVTARNVLSGMKDDRRLVERGLGQE